MENGFMLQFLVAAGVIAYGIWNAVQKSADQKRELDNRDIEADDNLPQQEMTWGEYFPSSVDIPAQPKSRNGAKELTLDKRKGSKMDNKNQDKYHLSTSSIEMTNDSTEDMYDESIRETGNKEVVTDLRTIILSSELLKPKYLEY